MTEAGHTPDDVSDVAQLRIVLTLKVRNKRTFLGGGLV